MAVDAITSAITSAVSNEMIATLVGKTKAQWLSQEFESTRFSDGENVDDFIMRLSNLVASMATVGEELENLKVVEKLLRVVPRRLSQVAIAIEVTADLTKLTLEDVKGQRRAVEDRAVEDEVPPLHVDNKLYLTQEEWEARLRSHQKGEGSSRGSGPKPSQR